VKLGLPADAAPAGRRGNRTSPGLRLLAPLRHANGHWHLLLARRSVRDFIALFGAAAVWPLPALAQQPAKIRLIGYLDYGGGISPSGGFAPFHDAYRRRPFLEGLRERGWIEGQNVSIERRFPAGQADRLPALAAELVALNVDVILRPPPQPRLRRTRPTGSRS
jgi:putative ABC transport system substrate-binding protein